MHSVYTVFDIVSPLKDQNFPKFVRGTGQRLFFLFSKILQLIDQRATGGLFDYYGIVHKEGK